MSAHRTRWAAGVLITALTATALTACSNGGSPSSTASKAASAASSAAASLASQGSDALASATAAAGKKLDEIKNGTDVKNDVTLGTPDTSSGRATVKVTARNTADSTKSFAVQVNFRDTGGNLLDTAVVTLSDVAARKDGTGSASSNRSLSGEVRAEVGRALRY
ncbi:hypothetical protein OH768_21975 [Streptomyces sp. NBC_01622]|uniref:hypothetical protein n=1 Tax=Streptomyces sp. NBC_01622 TaxID=2975903 RepID=UPI00386AEDCE|nr:hypothetical protein OH768_21975 [Streptomyces sp. NBC_01622]